MSLYVALGNVYGKAGLETLRNVDITAVRDR
jgi:hypothetical protein